jgi:hypothetical protein
VPLAEELLLLALDPVRGGPVDSCREPLRVCLRGALRAELGPGGHVTLEGRRFAVTGSVPAAGLPRDVDDALASPKGRRAADQPRRLGRGLGGVWQRVVARRSAGASWGGGVTASCCGGSPGTRSSR